jgi:3-methylcrotonyl-CoA carboxylase alpha subunit
VHGTGRVLAPIPGRVASVLVAMGDAVVTGQVLVVMEAMKMELSLTAPADGVVALVCCAVGDMVQDGHELVELSAPP